MRPVPQIYYKIRGCRTNQLTLNTSSPNRNSMPITSYDRKRNTTDLSLGHMSVAGFVFDDNEKSPHQSKSNQTSPPDLKTYLQVQHTPDGFPKLIRREENGELSLSAVSAALDLASPAQDSRSTPGADRAAASRHRISLPPSALGGSVNIAPLNGILANANETRPNNRRSMEVKFSAETKRPALLTTPPRAFANGSSMSSYSTNDLPTMKSIEGDEQSVNGGVSVVSPPLQSVSLTSGHASPEQNASFQTRFNTNPQSQDFAQPPKDVSQEHFNLPQSVLQASAAPFGPGMHNHNQVPGFISPTISPYAPQPAAYYGGYGVQMMTNGFNQMSVAATNGFGNANANSFNSQGQWSAQVPGPYPHAPLNHRQGFPTTGFTPHGSGRFDSTRANPNQRRQAAEEAQAKFQSIQIDQLVGEIYSLCKDQHGCRFLQRKLEERDEETVRTIFQEVHTHMVDLMVDPFGNYLCQKLLESTNDEQRTALIRNAMPAMTRIALNQHGTRALQKMIEYISTPEQTALIIEALRNDVVVLIQDLNGNHVIQKCLNHLSSQDAIFIFEAVGANCITVGTHRHGCCVLQRCIDHADGLQKGRMVDYIIGNAYSLVQDPFGNYVVQYILDLGEPSFTNPLCQAFLGEIVTLSRQKFSSNVIEKCIRCATGNVRRELVAEVMHPQNIEKLLRDGFANYVVQTAMEYADPDLKAILMENIRVVLPTIRNTPHGRRIQSKIADYDNHNANKSTSTLTSTVLAPTTPYAPVQQSNGPTRANRQGMIGAPPNWPGTGTGTAAEGYASPIRNGGDYGTTNGATSDDISDAPNGFSNVFSGESIASPAAQRGNYGIFNNAQNYQTIAGAQDFQAVGDSPNHQANGFASPASAGRQPYGHF